MCCRKQGEWILEIAARSALAGAVLRESQPQRLRVRITKFMRPRYLRRVLIFPLLCSCMASRAPAETAPKLRLDEVQQTQPIRYAVDLTLDPDKESFDGSIAIQLRFDKAASILWLNANGITVKSASLRFAGQQIQVTAVPQGDDFLKLTFPSEVPAGEAELRIAYSGAIRLHDTAGIFRATDRNINYLVTQFEEIDARKAFPCFDEPSYKVPWQLTLHVPAADVAVSNTPVQKKTNDGPLTAYEFKQTKPLPSYLIAFGVGPFEFVDAGSAGVNHVPVRIITPKGRANEARYAAQVTATLLTRLEQYFGIPYPYEKADQLTIPISAGFAMENAGLITYGQTAILARPEDDTLSRQREYAIIAAHELAHQWFGDLVTTAWWNDIWLNEAFATWMETKIVDEWKPEWHIRADAVSEKLSAERQDRLASARKIRQEIKSNDDIANAFDNITYLKGAAVIGMFEKWIGTDQFRQGVQNYMHRYAFRTATTGDFLDSISSANNKPITAAFSTFLDQPGVPAVSVQLRCAPSGEIALHLEQKRSLPLGSKADSNKAWQIPFCVRYGAGGASERECTLLNQPTYDWKLKATSCPAWVEANDQASGYYQVAYEGGLLKKLAQPDIASQLSAPEKIDLIGDAGALAASGTISQAEALGLVRPFHNGPERQVISGSMDLAHSIQDHLVTPDLRPNFNRFIRSMFGERAHQLGWSVKPGESDDAKLLRPDLLPPVALAGDEELQTQAKDITEKWLHGSRAIDASVLSAVVGVAARSGDLTLAKELVAQLKRTQDPQQQQQIVFAMLQFRDQQAIRYALDSVLSGDIPALPGIYLFVFMSQGYPDHGHFAFEYMQHHFDTILAKLPGGPFSSMLPRVGQDFCDSQSRAGVKAFFEPREQKMMGSPREVAHVIEEIDQCIALKTAQQGSVSEFLKQF
jgi:alanyl aminopeptidase